MQARVENHVGGVEFPEALFKMEGETKSADSDDNTVTAVAAK